MNICIVVLKGNQKYINLTIKNTQIVQMVSLFMCIRRKLTGV